MEETIVLILLNFSILCDFLIVLDRLGWVLDWFKIDGNLFEVYFDPLGLSIDVFEEKLMIKVVLVI